MLNLLPEYVTDTNLIEKNARYIESIVQNLSHEPLWGFQVADVQ